MRKITRKALALLAVLCLLLSITGAIVFADDPVTVNSGETMTVNENLEANITVKEDATLNITDEVTVTGNVINSGETNNNGEIDGRVANRDSGIVINNGDIEAPAAVANSGNFTNTSDGTIEGTIQNINDGTFTNNGTITPFESENGTATSPISNQGTFNNTETGNITANIINSGTVTNDGEITSPGTASAAIINRSEFQNTENGTINGRVSNRENATFINDGDIIALEQQSSVVNPDTGDTQETTSYSTLTNSGTFTNNENATIESNINNNDGTFTNNGIITTTENTVTITDADGNQRIQNTESGSINNTATFNNNETGEINGNIKNIGEATFINKGQITGQSIYNNHESNFENNGKIAATTEVVNGLANSQDDVFINHGTITLDAETFTEMKESWNLNGIDWPLDDYALTGTLTNHAEFENTGTINGNVRNQNDATFENGPGGAIVLKDGNTLVNKGEFVNAEQSKIWNDGMVINYEDGIFQNAGTVEGEMYEGTLDDTEAMTGNIINFGTFQVQESSEDGEVTTTTYFGIQFKAAEAADSSGTSLQQFVKGIAKEMTTFLTRDGFTLVGWSLGNDTYSVGDLYEANAPTTFIAIWEQNPQEQKEPEKEPEKEPAKPEEEKKTEPTKKSETNVATLAATDGITFQLNADGSTRIIFRGNGGITVLRNTIEQWAKRSNTFTIQTPNGSLDFSIADLLNQSNALSFTFTLTNSEIQIYADYSNLIRTIGLNEFI